MWWLGYRNKKGIDPIFSGEETTPRSGQESEKKMAKFPPQSKDGGESSLTGGEPSLTGTSLTGSEPST